MTVGVFFFRFSFLLPAFSSSVFRLPVSVRAGVRQGGGMLCARLSVLLRKHVRVLAQDFFRLCTRRAKGCSAADGSLAAMWPLFAFGRFCPAGMRDGAGRGQGLAGPVRLPFFALWMSVWSGLTAAGLVQQVRCRCFSMPFCLPYCATVGRRRWLLPARGFPWLSAVSREEEPVLRR